MYTELSAADRLELLELLIEKAEFGFVIIDQSHQIIEANSRFVEMLGYDSLEEVIGLHTWDYEYEMPQEEIVENFNDLSKVARRFESVHQRKDGTTYPVEVSMAGASIHGESRSYKAVMCICEDITLRKENEETLRYLSLHDQLTGVYNRVYFDDLLESYSHTGPYPVTLLLCDLDDLKIINDKLGHMNGDEMLRRTAILIESSLRKGDTIVRYGGDEFVVILPDTEEKNAIKVIGRINERIHHYNQRSRSSIGVTIGMATAHDGSISLKRILKMADRDMYTQKETKKASATSTKLGG
ncbi:diguanylate cyclase [Alkalibacter rhizosphaerae]|uniref:Diguanylate cyclase n=1 Tax=Alkalibacter rhizosphaerae TaxID=2815577 RepID=A0A974XEV9_9FIRM|nr:diguanylate cyclase [Alkalibacter rhizosphaerae]QSX08579.1 diguanylate cyclase [Alkalibacter rhizosphaerae]